MCLHFESLSSQRSYPEPQVGLRVGSGEENPFNGMGWPIVKGQTLSSDYYVNEVPIFYGPFSNRDTDREWVRTICRGSLLFRIGWETPKSGVSVPKDCLRSGPTPRFLVRSRKSYDEWWPSEPVRTRTDSQSSEQEPPRTRLLESSAVIVTPSLCKTKGTTGKSFHPNPV